MQLGCVTLSPCQEGKRKFYALPEWASIDSSQLFVEFGKNGENEVLRPAKEEARNADGATGRFGAPGAGMEVAYDSEGSRIVGDGDTIQE